MNGRCCDQHNGLAGQYISDPVDDQRAGKRKAVFRFVGLDCYLFAGYAGIVVNAQCFDSFTIGRRTHLAAHRDDGSGLRVFRSELIDQVALCKGTIKELDHLNRH